MRAGIVILTDQPWAIASGRWQRAEEYGFAHAWTYDHIGWRELIDGPWFDAVPTLTAAALATSSIRLGTLVASPNFRHPAHFAREITALDDLSGGRLTVGIGSGGIVGYDNEVLGRPSPSPRTRAERFEEFVSLLDRILVSDGGVTWSGRHYSVTDARSIPGCVQRPRAPFVIAAIGPRAMRLAARYGAGWVTTGLRSDDVESWWRTVVRTADQFAQAQAAEDRDPATMDRYLLLDPASPVYSLSSAGYFADAVERAAAHGFTDVVTYWPRESGWFAGDEAVLEAVAADVLPHLPP